jgi:hypothetical protein
MGGFILFVLVTFALFGILGGKQARRRAPRRAKTRRAAPPKGKTTKPKGATPLPVKTYKIPPRPTAPPAASPPQTTRMGKEIAFGDTSGIFAARPGTNSPAKAITWIPKGQTATIAGYTITGGMIYVGTPTAESRAKFRRFIDPNLPVAQFDNGSVPRLIYYPTYQTMFPNQRRNYLEWLASGRSNPAIEIGNVFLFFYGLEERITTANCSVQEEAQILEEVLRLRKIYSQNGSFNDYSKRFCDVVLAAQQLRSQTLARKAAPALENFDHRTALRHIAAIARCLADNIPLEFVKAYAAIVIQDFSEQKNHSRIKKLLAKPTIAASKAAFDERYAGGYRPRPAAPVYLRLPYKPAMGGEVIDFARLHGTPQVLDIRSYDWGDLNSLVDEIIGGPAREKRKSQADSTLAKFRQQSMINWLRHRCTPVGLVQIKELVANGLLSQGALPTIDEYRRLQLNFARIGFGVEPRLEDWKPTFGPETLIAVFPEGKSDLSGDFRLVAAILDYVTNVLTNLQGEERRDFLSGMIDRAIGDFPLTSDEYLRIKAKIHLDVKLQPPDRVPFTAKSIRAEQLEKKILALRLLVETLSKARLLNDAMVRDLEKNCIELKVPTGDLYRVIHEHSAGYRPPADSSGKSLASPGGPSSGGSSLDFARIEKIRAETNSVQAALGAVLGTGEDLVTPLPAAPAFSDPRLEGLAPGAAGLLSGLTIKPAWSRREFDQAARAAGQMPDGVIETINEWAYEKFDEPLIEEGDPLIINVGLLG